MNVSPARAGDGFHPPAWMTAAAAEQHEQQQQPCFVSSCLLCIGGCAEADIIFRHQHQQVRETGDHVNGLHSPAVARFQLALPKQVKETALQIEASWGPSALGVESPKRGCMGHEAWTMWRARQEQRTGSTLLSGPGSRDSCTQVLKHTSDTKAFWDLD